MMRPCVAFECWNEGGTNVCACTSSDLMLDSPKSILDVTSYITVTYVTSAPSGMVRGAAPYEGGVPKTTLKTTETTKHHHPTPTFADERRG